MKPSPFKQEYRETWETIILMGTAKEKLRE